jgi:hypothetical protein
MLLIVNVADGVLEGLLLVVDAEVKVVAEVESDVEVVWVGFGAELGGLAIVKFGGGDS